MPWGFLELHVSCCKHLFCLRDQYLLLNLFLKNMSTHPAIVTVAVRAPLEILQVPTVTPADGEVRVRNQWTASTSVDVHQNDGGLSVTHPQVLGNGTAGTVVEVGPNVRSVKISDKAYWWPDAINTVHIM
jgi:hypothetical protein